MNLFNQILQSYGFDGVHGLTLSMFPSFKYDLQSFTIPFSIALGAFCKFVGITPIVIVAMFVAVLVEVLSGTKASVKMGEQIKSEKFSRCVLKVFIWVSLFFIFHCFALDMASKSDNWVYLLGKYFFDITHCTCMIFFVFEYGISIAENLAVIDGKPKDAFVNTLRDYFNAVTDIFKRHKNNHETL